MSLVKSPNLTAAKLAANRSNAARSSSPAGEGLWRSGASCRSGEKDSDPRREQELNNPFLENEPTMSFRINESF
jgi:hypothetical protein